MAQQVYKVSLTAEGIEVTAPNRVAAEANGREDFLEFVDRWTFSVDVEPDEGEPAASDDDVRIAVEVGARRTRAGMWPVTGEATFLVGAATAAEAVKNAQARLVALLRG